MKFNQLTVFQLLFLSLLTPAQGQLVCEFFPHLCESGAPSTSPSTSAPPSSTPSQSPTDSPTKTSSMMPTALPSSGPTSSPSDQPSDQPSISPTKSTSPSDQPSTSPSFTTNPSSQPSDEPSISTAPSDKPTNSPSISNKPSLIPSEQPTDSQSPSTQPSTSPTDRPTDKPSINPSEQPTDSQSPTLNPSEHPSVDPTSHPSEHPSTQPTQNPSIEPSAEPSDSPTELPTESPTYGPRPNLIMVLTDEHNLRTLGCYRQIFIDNNQEEQAYIWGEGVEVETPHIDRLAAEGAIFTNFYTVAPLCTPSRASFMSGLYPQKTGANKNHGRMNDDIVTFAEILQTQRGYHTGYAGKWHLNGEARPGWSDPNSEFRRFGFKDSTYMWNRGHWKFIRNTNGDRNGFEFRHRNKFKGKEDVHFTTDYLFDRSLEFMKDAKSRNEPFAYVLSIPDPHAPNQVREPYEDMYKDMHFNLPKSGKKAVKKNPATPSWNYNDHVGVDLEDADQYLMDYENSQNYQVHLQQYFGMVKCIDDNIGKLLDFLDNEGLKDDTIVVFTSDHGDLLGEHGKLNKGRPFRTSAGVPFILRFPGKVLEGKKVSSALTSVDFAPSILSLMGVENNGGVNFHGTDFSKELLNSSTSTNYPRTRFIFDTADKDSPQWAAAIRRQIRLVVSRSDHPWLFDLDQDPYEVKNFFDVPRYATMRDSLLEDLKSAFEEFDDPIKDTPYMFWSTPACFDSPNRIKIDSKDYTCDDIGDTLALELCTTNQALRDHCAVTCNSCCEDSTGEIWVRGETLTCSQIQNECSRIKIRQFCPLSCGQCSAV